MKITKDQLKFLTKEIEESTEIYGKTWVYIPAYKYSEVYPTMKRGENK